MEPTTKPRPVHPFKGARKMKPTRAHRRAIQEVLLSTVEAWNAEGVRKYFDYDWDGARAYAGLDLPDADPRVWRENKHQRYTLYVKR